MNTTVKNLFKLFAELYNLRTAPEPGDKSKQYVKLDYYNGYRIDTVNPAQGNAEGHLYSCQRRTKAEMVAYLQGLILAKEPNVFEGLTK